MLIGWVLASSISYWLRAETANLATSPALHIGQLLMGLAGFLDSAGQITSNRPFHCYVLHMYISKSYGNNIMAKTNVK
jgi:hypothetical protein